MQKIGKIKSRLIVRPGILGLQTRLFILLGFIALVLLFTAVYVLYGLNLISSSSKVITEREMPLTRGLDGALLAILDGKIALEAAMVVDEFSRIEELREQEAKLNSSIILFDAYIAAITWGSESEAFLLSDGGLNFAEWDRLNLSENLTIKRPTGEQAQLAGITDIYFGGFANNALRAIASHKKFLRLKAEGEESRAMQAEGLMLQYKSRALRFSGLAIGGLSGIVEISNSSAGKSVENIEGIQKDVRKNLFLIFIVGFTLSLFTSLIFIRKSIIKPLGSLAGVAQKISGGNLAIRAKIKSRDEIGMLASMFNKMADRLAEYPRELEKTVQKRTKSLTLLNQRLQFINTQLEERNKELDRTAKILVRRDLELSEIRRQQQDQLKELDRIAKTLVRRDMELLRMNDELRAMDAAKSQFVSIAAHQLRTPLSIIKWTFRMLLSEDFGSVGKEQRAVIKRAYDVNENMIGLVSDLLDVARSESGRFTYNFESLSIEEVVDGVVQENALNIKEKGLTLKIIKLTKVTIPPVWADKERIKMVLQVLISNAINYTLPGGKIEVRYKKDIDFIEIQVRDTGVGVPAHQQVRLFAKFFRGDNVVRMQTQGTGLGLYIAASIIKVHDGQIGFDSEEGKGSTFWFRLPIKIKK